MVTGLNVLLQIRVILVSCFAVIIRCIHMCTSHRSSNRSTQEHWRSARTLQGERGEACVDHSFGAHNRVDLEEKRIVIVGSTSHRSDRHGWKRSVAHVYTLVRVSTNLYIIFHYHASDTYILEIVDLIRVLIICHLRPVYLPRSRSKAVGCGCQIGAQMWTYRWPPLIEFILSAVVPV